MSLLLCLFVFWSDSPFTEGSVRQTVCLVPGERTDGTVGLCLAESVYLPAMYEFLQSVMVSTWSVLGYCIYASYDRIKIHRWNRRLFDRSYLYDMYAISSTGDSYLDCMAVYCLPLHDVLADSRYFTSFERETTECPFLPTNYYESLF